MTMVTVEAAEVVEVVGAVMVAVVAVTVVVTAVNTVKEMEAVGMGRGWSCKATGWRQLRSGVRRARYVVSLFLDTILD